MLQAFPELLQVARRPSDPAERRDGFAALPTGQEGAKQQGTPSLTTGLESSISAGIEPMQKSADMSLQPSGKETVTTKIDNSAAFGQDWERRVLIESDSEPLPEIDLGSTSDDEYS